MVKATEAKVDWVRDRSTANGAVASIHTSIEKYLTDIGIYDSKARAINFDADQIACSIQRAAIRIKANHILERMIETLLRGGLLPTISLEAVDDAYRILDGLQRTHCMARALEYLILWEAGNTDDIPDYITPIFEKVGEHLLSVDEYLKQPVFLQTWRDITESESVRLFVALNIAQQRVSLRHILESLNTQIADLFASWGIKSYTEKALRAAGGAKRGKPAKSKTISDNKGVVPTLDRSGAFKLEYLINAVRAYIAHDPHVKTRSAMVDVYKSDEDLVEMGPRLVQSLMALGDETNSAAKDDFQWLFQDIHNEVSRIYAGNAQWSLAVATSDNFAFPILAALSESRASHPTHVDERKDSLLTVLSEADPGSDPLILSDVQNPESLSSIFLTVRSNIAGKMCRKTVYSAVCEYFRVGPVDDVVFDWDEASKRQL